MFQNAPSIWTNFQSIRGNLYPSEIQHKSYNPLSTNPKTAKIKQMSKLLDRIRLQTKKLYATDLKLLRQRDAV